MWGYSWTQVVLTKASGPPKSQPGQHHVSKGWTVTAVSKEALKAKCCIMDGLSCTVPKVFFKTSYFCIFMMSLEPLGLVLIPCKCCITLVMG